MKFVRIEVEFVLCGCCVGGFLFRLFWWMDWCDNFLIVDLMFDFCDRLNIEWIMRSVRELLYEVKVIEVGVVVRCCFVRFVDLVEIDYVVGMGGRELFEGVLVDLGMEIGWRRVDCFIFYCVSWGVCVCVYG